MIITWQESERITKNIINKHRHGQHNNWQKPWRGLQSHLEQHWLRSDLFRCGAGHNWQGIPAKSYFLQKVEVCSWEFIYLFYSLQGTGIENLAEYREKFIIGASFSSSSSLDISLSPNQPPVSVPNCFCSFDNFQFGIAGSRLWECSADRLVQLCPTARETSRTTSHQQRASQVILILDWYIMIASWLLNLLWWKILLFFADILRQIRQRNTQYLWPPTRYQRWSFSIR